MDCVDRRTMDIIGKMARKMDELEVKLGTQKDKTLRLTATLEGVIDKLSKLEAQNQACQAVKPEQPKEGKTNHQLLETLKYYSSAAEMVGQIMQVLANAAILAIETTRKGKYSSLGGGGSTETDFDLAKLLQAANELFRQMKPSDAEDQEDPL